MHIKDSHKESLDLSNLLLISVIFALFEITFFKQLLNQLSLFAIGRYFQIIYLFLESVISNSEIQGGITNEKFKSSGGNVSMRFNVDWKKRKHNFILYERCYYISRVSREKYEKKQLGN
ncbi:protein of unknown function [Acetoanaerobium sticklandii]|uniref:Uncharacterized protein n=1 Tax=Acetoanaerobium sticklandii (strain ATCC 12662 / DSM 519 / JCM 1433 / CCUG 9281 / NCIMB 10654 / HF) TaxID=499177 RepID=E3PY52_ACESD|nr:protein of unknown function [Acetoanaerobium sticklandii]